MRLDKELMGAAGRVLVLSVIARRPSYGYEVVKRLNDESRGAFEWMEGTVYPLLHKLEKDGLVRARWQDSEAGRRRKYYHVTAAGRAALAGGVAQWTGTFELIQRLTVAKAPDA